MLSTLAALVVVVAQPVSTAPISAEGERPVAEAGVLKVEVSGLRSSQGQLLVALFTRSEGFPDDHTKAHRIQILPLQGTRMLVTLRGLEPGTYAFAVVHDEDSDKRLDTNLVGIPKEGTGVTLRADAPKRWGPPRFEDATFTLPPAGAVLAVRVVYL